MPLNRLDRVSDLFFAIGDAILQADIGVSVGNYDAFDGVVRDATVLIELEGTAPADRSNDGRIGHQVNVTLHGVVARWREHAALEAANLATLLERLAKDNRWGLPGRQCGFPQNLRSGPSMFQNGAEGYDAWAASFTQTVYIGDVLEVDPVITAMPLAACSWQVPSLDDPAQYRPIEDLDP
jgi:hypothetical protein